jgi:Arc/MetJ family transcription regulator
MKTTVDIPDNLLKEAMRHSKASTKREAVVAALENFNRKHRMSRLREYLGKSDGFFTQDELDKLRAMD